ncbi:MAG: glycosyltransferase [Alphaproteobacteria bacterium]|nr:glycosyltransferase [Alphaproteobacteria bacterium]
MAPEVTILVPNYRTPEVTRLCLRLLRRHTDPARARVVVIDNDSADDSLDYLRSLDWITLLERKARGTEAVAKAHARALDLGLAAVETPYVLSIHTDTFVRRDDWLDMLLAPFARDPALAGVGSWKLEMRPWLQRWAKAAERQVQRLVFPLIGKGYGKLEGLGDNWYYLRSHCALYRTDPVRQSGLGFDAGDDHTPAGKLLHRRLEEQGWRMVFLPGERLSRYLVHVNHATMVLNPDLGAKTRTIRTGQRRLARIRAELGADAVLADTSLDR